MRKSPLISFGVIAALLAIAIWGGYLLQKGWSSPDVPARANRAATSSESTSAAARSPVRQGVSDPTATLRGSKHFMGIAGRAFTLDGLSVRDFVDKHSAAARAGDVYEAYRVYQAEALCADLPAIRRRAVTMKEASNGPEYAQDVVDVGEACDGVTPALMEERRQFLFQAAQGGIDDARIDFAFEGPPGNASMDDPNGKQWGSQVVAFLNASGNSGNSYALMLLSEVYQQGAAVPQDPEKALMYMAAVSQMMTGDPQRMLLVSQLSTGLPAPVAANAIQQGKALALQIKRGQS